MVVIKPKALLKKVIGLLFLLVSLPASASQWSIEPAGYQFNKPDFCPAKASSRHGYKICEDQIALVKQALKTAKQQKKLLIVKFGADWCPWCRKLHKLMPSKQVLGYTIDGFGYDTKFNIVEIATSTTYKSKGVQKIASGRIVSNAVLKSLKVSPNRVKGIPYLVILDPQNPGKGIYKRSKYLESRFLGLFYHYKGISYEPANIRAMLQKSWYQLRR